MGNRQQKRRAITAQCVYGEDDDLITWYESLPYGTGQSEVKRMLRKALGIPQPKVEQQVSDAITIDAIQRMIDDALDDHTEDTKQWVMHQLSSLSYTDSNGNQSVAMDDVMNVLDESAQTRRMENLLKDDWS